MSTCINCTNLTLVSTQAEFTKARILNSKVRLDIQCKNSTCTHYSVSAEYLTTPHNMPCDRYQERST